MFCGPNVALGDCCADFPLECTRRFLAAVLAGRSEPGGVHGEFRAQVASDGFLRAVFMKIQVACIDATDFLFVEVFKCVFCTTE